MPQESNNTLGIRLEQRKPRVTVNEQLAPGASREQKETEI